ncbi:regulatory protein RecX [Candidatus Collierbacteria bacterium]|nr:regulatory protein RecX [Candidatus Collierbacteria bacterium]
MAKRQTLHFLSFRLRSVAEVKAFLSKKNHPPETVQKAVDELLEHKFLDDQAFANWWAGSRIKQGWGQIKIKSELKMKGIDEEIISSVIARDWGKIIKEELKDRDRSLKIRQWLAGRGFTYSQINRAFDDFTING